jgi:cysteinyl-tRNA synthetase
MAQCEAFFDCGRWVNTFLHSGHLSIDGRKMSKSLKNFITVSEALERYSPSQVRADAAGAAQQAWTWTARTVGSAARRREGA